MSGPMKNVICNKQPLIQSKICRFVENSFKSFKCTEFKEKICEYNMRIDYYDEDDISEIIEKSDCPIFIHLGSQAHLNEALQDFNHITHGLLEKKDKFIDDQFPPSDSSLFVDPQSPKLKRPIKWKRASEFKTKGDWVMYSEKSSPAHINQGQLGDCWLMSAIAVLSEKPKMISRLILSKTFSDEGIYLIKICEDGIWTNVTIDDYLPTDNEGKLIFSQLWVPLVEKAIAKLSGSYEAIIKGHCIDGLMMLTGAPCETIFVKDVDNRDEFWRTLVSSKNADCACGNLEIPKTKYSAIGLQSFHAYSILDVEEYKGDRIIKLRNPWGSTGWKGQYSSKSNAWTSSTINNYDPSSLAKSGIFWISLNDFLMFFNSVDICRSSIDYHEARIRYKDQFTVYVITVENETELIVTLHQKRLYDKGKHMDLMVAVLAHDSMLQTIFQLFFLLSLRDGLPPHSTLVVRTNRKASIEKIMANKQILFNRIVLQIVKTAESKVKVPVCNGTVYQMIDRMSGLIVAAVNPHHKLYMKVKCDCSPSNNVVSVIGKLVTNDKIGPKSACIINILTQNDTSKAYTVSTKSVTQVTKL